MQPKARVREGDVLAGKYRVERVLGSGGMGVVVAARHMHLDVLVALKFMTDETLTRPEMVARFLREARAAARLRSEHVARVTDVGTLDSGAPYLVMEYLEGSDLSEVLDNEGPQPIASAVACIVQASEALDEAHAAGIVHRDIKPSNLFLTRRPNGTPCVKVLDFGISKSERLGSASAKLHATHSRAVLGSPCYMPPEQMRAAGQVDARGDIWALGATLYELLAGRVPFEADSLLDLALQIAQDDPQPLRGIRPEIPWPLEQIVLRCLEKDRDNRFATARALSSALAPFAVVDEPPAPLRVLARADWDVDGLLESSADAVTRVARPPAGSTTDTEPQHVREALRPHRMPRLDPGEATVVSEGNPMASAAIHADAALPMTAVAYGSVPPVARSTPPPPGRPTGAQASGGSSNRPLGERAGAAWSIAVVGMLAVAGGTAAFALRSHATTSRGATSAGSASVARVDSSPPVAGAPARFPSAQALPEGPLHSAKDLPIVKQQATPPAPPTRPLHVPPVASLRTLPSVAPSAATATPSAQVPAPPTSTNRARLDPNPYVPAAL